MGADSKIPWTHHTFNPWWGCVKVSPGCKHCYAESLSKRYGHNVWGVNGERRLFGDHHWEQPLKWNRKAKKNGVRYRVFCGSMCDVFELDKPNDDTLSLERMKLWYLIGLTPQLDWLLLTKRPENWEMIAPMDWLLNLNTDYKNVWIGTSAESQKYADLRIPYLLEIPAKVRFLSCEPLLDPIDLGRSHPCGYYCDESIGHVDHDFWTIERNTSIKWIIVGGESGPNARPMNIDWARSIRDQCQDAGVAFFMKQMGGHPNKREDLDDIPEDLRIREFPDDQN